MPTKYTCVELTSTCMFVTDLHKAVSELVAMAMTTGLVPYVIMH